MTSRSWTFTLNNWTMEEFESIQWNEKISYLIMGKEIGEQGTPHLQGYLRTKNSVRFSAIKRIVGNRAHIEQAKGSPLQNIEYCSKDGDFVEVGTRPITQQQKGEMERQRYQRAWELARQNRIEEIDADIRIHSYGTLKRIGFDATMERTLEDTTEDMLWYYGPSGTGKSRKARTDHPDAYLKMCNRWWDGYTQEETVLMEDLDKKHEGLAHHLKIWADRYPFPAEIKGGKINIRPKRIIVTSNYHPSDIWTDERDLAPILRRFKIVHFAKL